MIVGLARRARLPARRCEAALAAGRRRRAQLPGHRGLAGQEVHPWRASMTFKAFRIHETRRQDRRGLRAGRRSTRSRAGDVVVRVQYSSINYKDALAGDRRRQDPAQVPAERRHRPRGRSGELGGRALQAGRSRCSSPAAAISETLDGGYAQFARSKGDFVIPLPDGMSAFDAMALGTAGFTAALAVHRMEQNGQRPAMGPIARDRRVGRRRRRSRSTCSRRAATRWSP